MPTHDIPAVLRKRLANQSVIPFVGSGVSRSILERSSGRPLFPSWKSFLAATADCLEAAFPKEPKFPARLRNAAKFDDEIELWLSSLDFAKRSLGGDGWNELLEKLFDPEQEQAEESSLALARKVWSLGSNLVITTNFDQSLHWAARSHCREIRPGSRAELAKILKESPTKPHVWHLHGSIGSLDELAVTTSDYNKLYQDTAFQASQEAFRQLASNRSLLFVGYSLRDFELLRTIEERKEIFAGSTPTHYALLSEKDTARVKQQQIPVRPITYQDHDSHLHQILDDLISGSSLRGAAANQKTQVDAAELDNQAGDQPPVRSAATSISLAYLFKEYTSSELIAKGCQSTTVRDLESALKRWNRFEQSVRSEETGRNFYFIEEIDTKLLQRFRRWLLREKHTVSTSIRAAASIVRILGTAKQQGLIDQVPKNSDGATVRRHNWKPLLQMDQLSRIWKGTEELTWPTVTKEREKPAWSTEEFWKAALVMWLTYGLRRQELIIHDSKYTPLLWRDIEWPNEHLRIDGSEFGWFSYIPQQQRRFKPDPIRLPLTKSAYLALLKMRPENPRSDSRVFDAPLTNTTSGKMLRMLAKSAGMPEVGGKLPTLIRETAIQNLEFKYVGISEHVVGKAHNRSAATRFPRPGGSISLTQAFLECYTKFDTYDDIFEDVDRPE